MTTPCSVTPSHRQAASARLTFGRLLTGAGGDSAMHSAIAEKKGRDVGPADPITCLSETAKLCPATMIVTQKGLSDR